MRMWRRNSSDSAAPSSSAASGSWAKISCIWAGGGAGVFVILARARGSSVEGEGCNWESVLGSRRWASGVVREAQEKVSPATKTVKRATVRRILAELYPFENIPAVLGSGAQR